MGLFGKTDTIEEKKVPCFLNRRIRNGRYLLDKRIGSGGYSVVYRAIDLDRPVTEGKIPNYVAVKCILARNKARNEREFQLHRVAAAKIPGVIQVYDIFTEKNICFAVLEYCPGGDLFTGISDYKLFFGCESVIRKIFLQILDIISSLHDLGIYHRDLKPDNFLLTADLQSVRLADFGLATTSEFSTSFGCGSWTYMTPESLTGTKANGVEGYSSRASDIWALGIILINMVAGRNPWKLASHEDKAFAFFKKNPGYLTLMFPISPAAVAFCNAIFLGDGKQLCVKQLRKEFARIDTFYMSPAQLEKADRSAREIGRDLPPGRAPLRLEELNTRGCSVDSRAQITDLEDPDGSSLISDQQSDLSESSCMASGVDSNSDDSLSDSSSEGPITPETKPVRFKQEECIKPLRSPIAEEPWVRSPWLLDAFRKKFLAEYDSEDADDLGGIEYLVI